MLSETKWSIGGRRREPRSGICYSLSAIVPLGSSMRLAFLDLNVTVVLIFAVLVSCSPHFPATVIIRNKILRGSASDGTVRGDVSFSVQNLDGLSCDGKMLVHVTSVGQTTSGIIDCNNEQNGYFIVDGRKSLLSRGGKVDDGSRFLISIGR